MKLDEKALKAAFYVFMDAKAKEAAIDRLRLVIEAYLATLPADDALIEKLEAMQIGYNAEHRAIINHCIFIIRQHQSIQTPPICNDSGKDVNKPPEYQSGEGEE